MTTNSPASANYKYGNYFRFPDVDIFTPPAAVKKDEVIEIKDNIIEIEEESDVTESQETSETTDQVSYERKKEEAEHSALILQMQAMSIDSDKEGTVEEFPKVFDLI